MQYARELAVINNANPEPGRSRQFSEVGRGLRLEYGRLSAERTCPHGIRGHIRANGVRHPLEISGMKVERFLGDLARRDRVAPSTRDQALSALLFLYPEVLALLRGQWGRIHLRWLHQVCVGPKPARVSACMSPSLPDFGHPCVKETRRAALSHLSGSSVEPRATRCCRHHRRPAEAASLSSISASDEMLVTPAKAGVQDLSKALDSGFRRNDAPLTILILSGVLR